MKYEKRFKAYKFFFILSLYKQFICKPRYTVHNVPKLTKFFSPKMRRLFEGGA